VSRSFIGTCSWILLNKIYINFFDPISPFLVIEIDLHGLNIRGKSGVTRIQSTLSIFMISAIIGIMIGSDAYVTNSLAIIKQGLIVEVSMLSELSSYIDDVEHTVRITLKIVPTSLYNSIHRNSCVQVGYQSGGRMTRSIVASQMVIVSVSYGYTLLCQLIQYV